MKKILAFALLVMPCFGAVAFDNFAAGSYAGAGVNSTTITASGTNIGCVVAIIHRGGTYLINPTCNGQSMTEILSGSSMTNCVASTIQDIWVAFSGITAGSIVATASMSIESQIVVITVNGAKQSGQPDSTAALVTGNYIGVSGGQEAALPYTAIANNSLVIGSYCSGTLGSTTPSSNGTYLGADGNFGSFYWRSTTTAASGSGALQAKNSSGNAAPFNAQGLTIAPLGSTFVANPTIVTVGP